MSGLGSSPRRPLDAAGGPGSSRDGARLGSHPAYLQAAAAARKKWPVGAGADGWQKARPRQPPGALEPPCPFPALAAAPVEDPAHGCAERLLLTRSRLLEEAEALESVIASLTDGASAESALEHLALVGWGCPDDRAGISRKISEGAYISEGAEVMPTEQPAQPSDESAECPPQPGQGESTSEWTAERTAERKRTAKKRVTEALFAHSPGARSPEVVDVIDCAVASIEHKSGGALNFTPSMESPGMSRSSSSRHHQVLFNGKQTMSTAFEFFFGAVIGTNALVSGVEVQYRSMNMGEDLPDAFIIIRHAYTLLFLVEIVARICTLGPSKFFTRGEVFWAWLDSLVVLMGLLEMAMDIVQMTSHSQGELPGAGVLRNVRLARLVRLTRAFRLHRIIRFIAALRTLVYSIMATLKSLCWAMALLFMIMYVFGLAFTMETLDYIESVEGLDRSEVTALTDAWGSLDVSMYTLFQSISGGVSWGDPAVPLQSISILPTALFTVYIAFVYFAVLNVVTGVFCSSAVETTQRNPDLVAKSLVDNRRACADKLQQLFGALDEDGSGLITIDELELIAEDDLVKAYFQALQIDFRDAWTLFKLIDHSNDGAIKMDDFLKGCEKLRGAATSMEMAEISYDVRKLSHKVHVLMELLKRSSSKYMSKGTSSHPVRGISAQSTSSAHKLAACRRMAGTMAFPPDISSAPARCPG